jgi:predicted ATPase
LTYLAGEGHVVGSGKSRLALRYAADAQASYAERIWLVELAAITGPELVGSALAAALSVREKPGVPLLESVVERLAGSRALLVMDNCEHVLGGVAEIVTGLLRATPAVRVLVTSQSRLGIEGEASWPVPPLALPAPTAEAGDIRGAEAVRLLCDRAVLSRPGFRLTDDNAQAVADICRRLDGIPLAIELAAARLNMLTARQLAARLDDRFRLLTGGSRATLPRHRALLAAIEWSHELLTPAERVCLRRLAVFSGGCTLEGAEAVCPDDHAAAGAVFEMVCSLVDKSLLTTEERSGSMRYGMLELVRHYVLRQLDAAGERSELERRHLTWALEYARQADLDGPDQGAWLELIEADLDNFRAALERALDTASSCHDRGGALELAGLLAAFWEVRGPIELGRRRLAAALAAAGPDAEPRLRALALYGAGRLALIQGDQEAQLACQQESLAIWRSLGDLAAVARCLGEIGAVQHVRGDYAAARACYAEALELGSRSADDAVTARSLSGLGRLALFQNDLVQATAYYQESMARFQAIGDLRRATTILGNLGVVAFHQGQPDLAVARFREHLANARRLGDRKLIGGALVNLGDTLYSVGELSESASVPRQALEIAGQIGDRRMTASTLTNLGLVAHAQRDYRAAWHFQQRSLAMAVAVGEQQAIYESVENIAALEAAVGRPERAARLFGAVRALRETVWLANPGRLRHAAQGRRSIGGTRSRPPAVRPAPRDWDGHVRGSSHRVRHRPGPPPARLSHELPRMITDRDSIVAFR